ncbi:hypothetical protein EDB92DRAFT_1834129 [Lactarius akahatsu]|uniref:MARVEL domain-containing protein n=1 Tax=Lactarius akahatsu TaxID=416441 RepID=A0AAD4LQ37_9AGAM|nr:hypothetical protein EDB92DRAFT_1834129 [Lactarius akahatsu]
MTWLPTARLIAFATVSLFSLIVLALSADLIALTEPFFYYKFAALALATSIMTLFSVIPMFVVDIYRQGSVFSYIIVEIGWLSFLWVLWLSSGSYAAWTDDQLSIFGSSCGDLNFFGDNTFSRGCGEIKAIAAFSFLTWIILMGYTGVLLFLAIRAQERGHRVWKMSVREDTVLFEEAKSAGTPAQVPAIPASLPQSYPPVPTHGSVQV